MAECESRRKSPATQNSTQLSSGARNYVGGPSRQGAHAAGIAQIERGQLTPFLPGECRSQGPVFQGSKGRKPMGV